MSTVEFRIALAYTPEGEEIRAEIAKLIAFDWEGAGLDPLPDSVSLWQYGEALTAETIEGMCVALVEIMVGAANKLLPLIQDTEMDRDEKERRLVAMKNGVQLLNAFSEGPLIRVVADMEKELT